MGDLKISIFSYLLRDGATFWFGGGKLLHVAFSQHRLAAGQIEF